MSENSEILSFMKSLKDELSSLRNDLKQNKEDMHYFQHELTEMKKEIIVIRQDGVEKANTPDVSQISEMLGQTTKNLDVFKQEITQNLLQFKQGLFEDKETFMNRRIRSLSVNKPDTPSPRQDLPTSGYEKVKLNIGGVTFETVVDTLTHEDNFLKNMLKLQLFNSKENGEYFIDRDPKYFPFILKYLRTLKVYVSELSKDAIDELIEEVDFYQIQSLKKRILLIINFKPDTRMMQQLLNNDPRLSDIEVYNESCYQALSLSNPPIVSLKCYALDSKSIPDLCEFLEKNKTLLRFSCPFENEPDISRLFFALSKNSMIKEVDLKISFEERDQQSLIAMIQNNTSIEKLTIFCPKENLVTVLKALNDGIERNRSLVEFRIGLLKDFKVVSTSDQEEDVLVKYFESIVSSNNLKKLSITGNYSIMFLEKLRTMKRRKNIEIMINGKTQ